MRCRCPNGALVVAVLLVFNVSSAAQLRGLSTDIVGPSPSILRGGRLVEEELSRVATGADGTVITDGAPTLAPFPENLSDTRIMQQVPGVLQKSSDKVGRAVSHVLGVQGNLDDLRLDLMSEYKQWESKKQHWIGEQQMILQQISDSQAEQRAQSKMRAEADRLKHDLADALNRETDLNSTVALKQEEWSSEEAQLKRTIEEWEKKINDSIIETQQELAGTRNQTEVLLRRWEEVVNKTMVVNATIHDIELQRAAFNTSVSQLHSRLLQQENDVGAKIQKVEKQLRDQLLIVDENRHLARQSHEVVEQLEKVEARRVNCTNKVQAMSEEISFLVKQTGLYEEKLHECKTVESSNQELMGCINECKIGRCSYECCQSDSAPASF